MKRGIILMVAMNVGIILFAQQELETQAELMKEELSLNENQYTQIKDILQKYSDKRKALEVSTAAWENNQAAMDSLDFEKRKQIEAVLTNEQHEKWTAYKKERRINSEDEEYAQRKVERMRAELQLSDQQAKKLEEITKDYREHVEKMKGIQRNSGQLQPEAFIRAKSEYRDAVQSILSKEQYQKWIKMDENENGQD